MADGEKKKKPGGDEQVGWGLHASFSTRPRTLETTARTQRSRELVLGSVSRHFDRATNAFYQRPSHLRACGHRQGGNNTRRQSAKPSQKCCTPLPPFPTPLPVQPWPRRNLQRILFHD